MATKRMIAKEILMSDKFLQLPVTARLLYIYITVFADDDGICDNPKFICSIANATDGDITALVNNEFIYFFENYIVIVADWLTYNRVKPSIYQPSKHTKIRDSLCVNKNGSYTLSKSCRQHVDNISKICRHNAEKMSRSIDTELDIDTEASIDNFRTKRYPTKNSKKESTYKNNYDFDAIEKFFLEKKHL